MSLSDKEFIEHCDKIIKDIRHEGFDYYLSDYEDPEKFKVADPKMYQLWQKYLFISGEIRQHLSTAGGRREVPSDGEPSREVPSGIESDDG